MRRSYATKKAYTAITTKDSVTVLATPRGEDYTITYNGETSNVIPLTMGENKIEIAITNKDGYTNSYTLTVTKADHAVTIPTGESFLVTGKEAVMDGADYTFTVEIDYRYEAGRRLCCEGQRRNRDWREGRLHRQERHHRSGHHRRGR